MRDYLWFIEFQERGAPHIHLMLDFVEFQIKMYRHDLAKFWAETVEPPLHYYTPIDIRSPKRRKLNRKETNFQTTRGNVQVVHSHPSQWEPLRTKDGAARYATMYASKTKQKLVPEDYKEVGRFWGTPQHLSLKKLIKTWVWTDEEGARAMIKKMGRDFSTWEHLPKIILGDTSEICKILDKIV